MRAAVMRDRKLVVADVPVPAPGPGEVLVRTLACGICGSDLHALKHADAFVATSRRAGNPRVMDLARDVVMGHEFCAEIVEHGPGTTRALPVGTRVCSRPVLMRDTGPQTIGYSNDHPGGYGQYMRLSEALLLEVPSELPSDHAALTEPMAVGLHAVRKAGVMPQDAPLVIGCGPVGLAVIAALRLRDLRPIVAADFSPRRRELLLRVAEHELQAELLDDAEHRRDRVRLHAHADDDDAGVARRRRHQLIEDTGHADALEHDRRPETARLPPALPR